MMEWDVVKKHIACDVTIRRTDLGAVLYCKSCQRNLIEFVKPPEHSLVRIYTDGACSGNPGPGGYAFIVEWPEGNVDEYWGWEEYTTSNQMELMAALKALEMLHKGAGKDLKYEVYTDSRYLKRGITEWIQRWLVNGWQTATGKPVKNRELWQQLHDLDLDLNIAWRWTRGHDGHKYNERADELARGAIRVKPTEPAVPR